MTYFDTAYIAKCYLNEPRAAEVRALARRSDHLCSSAWARVEFSAVLHRHRREGHLRRRDARRIMEFFTQDENAGVWTWLPVTPALLQRSVESFESVPEGAFLRAADAVHLTCARENGLEEVYSNDRHFLACARHFGLAAVNILEA